MDFRCGTGFSLGKVNVRKVGGVYRLVHARRATKVVGSGSSGRREKDCGLTATRRIAASTTLASYMTMMCERQWIVADASALQRTVEDVTAGRRCPMREV
jgi:hypothetical protein